MTAKKDIVGKKFGRLTVMRDEGKRKNSRIVWLCRCDCGELHEALSSSLMTGHTKSCGCLKDARLIGRKFDKLKVIKELPGRSTNGHKIWLCQCDCGNETEVTTGRLKNGTTKSCGCLKHYYTGERNPMYNPDKTDEERMLGRYIIGGMSATKWRKEVFNRDNYTCLICNQYGGALNAHHLDGWGWCKERRFDITNGVTLCVSCHKNYHKIYGTLNNTEKQFEEYIIKNKKHKQLALF